MNIIEKRWFRFLLLAVMLALVLLLCIDLIPLFKEVLQNTNNESKLINYIEAYGAKGVPIIIGLQILAVIASVFPDAPIQVLAGLCYGVWLGTLICLAGYIAGNSLLFIVVRLFQKGNPGTAPPAMGHTTKAPKWFSLERLRQAQHPEFIAFFLYLIPGIPTGMLPYLLAQTKIPFIRYLVAVTLGSTPVMLLCTWIGRAIAANNYRLAILLTAIAGIVLLLLFLFRKTLIQKAEQFLPKKQKNRKPQPK